MSIYEGAMDAGDDGAEQRSLTDATYADLVRTFLLSWLPQSEGEKAELRGKNFAGPLLHLHVSKYDAVRFASRHICANTFIPFAFNFVHSDAMQ